MKTLVLEESEDFKLEALIGEGSFSKVYDLKHLKTNKIYALKAFKLKKYEKFSLNEAEILTKLKHPNIIKIKRLCTYKNRVSKTPISNPVRQISSSKSSQQKP